MATNEDGVRSRNEARLPLVIDPRWFETWWARLLAFVLLIAALWGIVRLRVAALHAQQAELKGLVAKAPEASRLPMSDSEGCCIWTD
ncbi:MAG: hypothetical protein WB973_09910 [Thermoanaerobaculia bacterium]